MSSIIKTDNLIVGYDKPLIENICLEVKPGEIMTLIGPNGCGKSTILKTIITQLNAKGGVVYLDGKDMSLLKESDIAKKMSMVMTSKVSTELMTCREIVQMGRYPYTGRFGTLSDEDKKIVNDTMRLLKADEVADADFNNISDGQRQRVMIARAICQNPKVLILDEPTSYLDIKYKLEILDVIKKLAKERNIAIVMSLHELDFAMNISDKVVALKDKKIEKIGTPKEIFEESFIRKLYDIEGIELGINESSLWRKDSSNSEQAFIKKEEIYTKSNISNIVAEETAQVRESGSQKKTRVIMVQGTMSNAGKSMLVAGLCRIFKQDGYRVAPFKSQNMALNSYITDEGLEMGRAQVMQAECAGIKPMVAMNPILLKPTDNMGSQVIVNGEIIGNMRARDYFEYKTKLVPDIMKAYNRLCEVADIIVVEGAGSPAEINLKSNDIVNMGLAKMLDAPVLLVGDIDRGGVFAQLLGTLNLLEDDEKSRVKGLIINKFRGDITLLNSGVEMLEKKGETKVVGIVPYMDIHLEDEDSLSERFENKKAAMIDIAVIRLPHISNFTDFDVFEQFDDVSIRYVDTVSEFKNPDMVIIPGTKNTIADLRWLKDKGLHKCISACKDIPIFGICGGYQMLGEKICDPYEVEAGGEETGLGLLEVETTMGTDKVRTQYEGKVVNCDMAFCDIKDAPINGYEIHMGETRLTDDKSNACVEFTSDQTGYCKENIFGSYIHGLFDNREMVTRLVNSIAVKKNIDISSDTVLDYSAYKETQYNRMADILREYLDMDEVYKILGV